MSGYLDIARRAALGAGQTALNTHNTQILDAGRYGQAAGKLASGLSGAMPTINSAASGAASIAMAANAGRGAANTAMQAAQPQQQPLKIHNANFGTFTDSAAADLRQMGLLPPTPGLSGGGYEAPRVDYAGQQNMLKNANSYLTGLADRYSNPYARGGTAYESNMNYAQSQPSGLLQNAMKSTQRAAGLSGFGQNSGLVQQQMGQHRLAAAKEAARLGADVERDMSIRSADWADRDQQFRFNLAQAMQANDFGAFDRLRQQENDIYGRRLDGQLDPLRVGSAQQSLLAQGLSNQATGLHNQYLPRQLQQGVDLGRLNIEGAQMGNDFNRATYDDRLGATRAELGYNTANYGGLTQMTQEGLADFNSQYARNLREANRNPLFRGAMDFNNGFLNFQLQGAKMAAQPLGMAGAIPRFS
jgi:hypothetical protein